jgi:hypothetical protein
LIGVVRIDYHVEMKVRLDDGTTGFVFVFGTPGVGPEYLSDKEAAAYDARIAHHRAVCAAKPKASIGMTEAEVRVSNWGAPVSVNTTELAGGERAQWVYFSGPCDAPEKASSWRGYLYFDNGKLVAIQR